MSRIIESAFRNCAFCQFREHFKRFAWLSSFVKRVLRLDKQVLFSKPICSQRPADARQIRLPLDEAERFIPLISFGVELDQRLPIAHFTVYFRAQRPLTHLAEEFYAALQSFPIAFVEPTRCVDKPFRRVQSSNRLDSLKIQYFIYSFDGLVPLAIVQL
jgi:hypothetical protein